ncbi:MAG: hypothetical protein NXH99_17655 [Rhodobacteraceae bacterium]|nr:hypothetical protein [Paracoccaceae bacterium]
MLLTSDEIDDQKIVTGSCPARKRATTYDATVGSIIQRGREIKAEEYHLPPRGIVWVVSAEIFDVPDDATGLATLRTTWTHDGVLALNVGVVDPFWKGPLAAAVVNFGSTDFEIKKGDPFLRLMFHRHAKVSGPPIVRTMDEYKNEIISKSKIYSSTFLSMELLVPEISEKVYSMPKWAYYFAMIGLIIAFAALLTPVAVSVFTDYYVGREKIESIEQDLERLKTSLDSSGRITQIETRLTEVETAIEGATNEGASPASAVEPLPEP